MRGGRRCEALVCMALQHPFGVCIHTEDHRWDWLTCSTWDEPAPPPPKSPPRKPPPPPPPAGATSTNWEAFTSHHLEQPQPWRPSCSNQQHINALVSHTMVGARLKLTDGLTAALLGHGCCNGVLIGKIKLLEGQLRAFCSSEQLKALGKVQQALCLLKVLSA